MNNYLFIDAVSYLDADLLASHLERKDKLRNKLKSKRKVNILRWSAVAACLSVFLIAIIVIDPIPTHNTSNIQYGYTQEHRLFYKGDKSISEYGVIEFIDFDDGSITLQVEKTTSDYVYATLCGYNVDPSTNTKKVYLGTTISKAQVSDVIIVADGIQLFVDGKLTSEFPKEAGQYTIRIEFSNLKESCEQLDVGIYISGFEYFVINPFTIEGIDPGILTPNTNGTTQTD